MGRRSYALVVEWPPDAWVVTQYHSGCVGLLRRSIPVINCPVLQKNGCTHFTSALSVGMAGQRAGPGDVAVAGGIMAVAAFAEDPLAADKRFAQREVIGGDVRLASGEALLGGGELVHQ